MSSDDSDKPKRERLRVREEALGENEMFRVKRRTVTLHLEGASEADLREFDAQVHGNEQIDISIDQILVAAWKKIEAQLGELGFPPPRGWGREREDHTWEHLSETDNTKIAEEFGTMVELHDPNTGRWIEKTANCIKRCTEVESRPWWLAHLGDSIIRILNEPDPDKKRTHIYHYGRHSQRYLDQHGHLPAVQHGGKFPTGNTVKANEARSRKRAKHKESVISLCNRALRKGKGRKKNDTINCSELARIFMDAGYRDIKEQRVRKIIAKAIRDRDLV